MAEAAARPIGILAGSGALPVEAAAAITSSGRMVHVAMVDDLADAALKKYPHTHINWAQVGRAMSAFKAAGVRDVVMLGATGRPSLRNARPDWGFMKALPSVVRLLNAGGDDAVLKGLITLFERNGLRIVGIGDVAPRLLVDVETPTRNLPSVPEEDDIARGFALVRALGPYDIGQGVVVASGRIEAIEAAEGTDRMLARLARERDRRGGTAGGVLVKRPKPGQDLRVDLPAIGANTLRYAQAAGLAGVAVMAGKVLAAGRAEMIRAADGAGLFIAGRADDADLADLAVSARPGNIAVHTLSPRGLPQSERRNLPPAAGAIRILAETGKGALVILGGRVLSIGIDEPYDEIIARSLEVRRGTKRSGLAAIDAALPLSEETVRAVERCRLAGILLVCTDGQRAGQPPPSVLSLVDGLGLAVVVTEGEAA